MDCLLVLALVMKIWVVNSLVFDRATIGVWHGSLFPCWFFSGGCWGRIFLNLFTLGCMYDWEKGKACLETCILTWAFRFLPVLTMVNGYVGESPKRSRADKPKPRQWGHREDTDEVRDTGRYRMQVSERCWLSLLYFLFRCLPTAHPQTCQDRAWKPRDFLCHTQNHCINFGNMKQKWQGYKRSGKACLLVFNIKSGLFYRMNSTSPDHRSNHRLLSPYILLLYVPYTLTRILFSILPPQFFFEII